jgi:hypothetical protein
MSYLAVVSFDLTNAAREDYVSAYEALVGLGLCGTLRSDRGAEVDLPTTTCAGEFTGPSSSAVRDSLKNRIDTAFNRLGLRAKTFVTVGDGWAWVQSGTPNSVPPAAPPRSRSTHWR